MLTVETDPAGVEERLRSGGLACPGCAGVLAGWGRARARTVRDRDGGLRLALGEPDRARPPGPPGGAGTEAPRGVAEPGGAAAPLAEREADVARLVADGLTNKQIGARLFISERTVDSHVRSILNKLGVGSRAQIAAWVATLDP